MSLDQFFASLPKGHQPKEQRKKRQSLHPGELAAAVQLLNEVLVQFDGVQNSAEFEQNKKGIHDVFEEVKRILQEHKANEAKIEISKIFTVEVASHESFLDELVSEKESEIESNPIGQGELGAALHCMKEALKKFDGIQNYSDLQAEWDNMHELMSAIRKKYQEHEQMDAKRELQRIFRKI